MGSYYYLMAQLPTLIYGQKPPMSSESFKTLASALMNNKDAAFLNKLTLAPSFNKKASSGCSFLDKLQDWERTLRFNLAKERAMKLKRENELPSDLPSSPIEAVIASAKAIEETSPLEGEFVIDKARWNAIEALAGNDYFHRNTAFAYYLKLLLIERREAFDEEKGFTEYKLLYASILKSAENSLGENK